MSNFPTYPAILFMDDGQYGVIFPDLAGCVCTGASIDDAMHKAGEALLEHLDMLQEQGANIPHPSPKDTVHLPNSFGRSQYSVILVSAGMNYYQDIPPHW